MSTNERSAVRFDKLRRFMGDRWKAAQPTQKVMALSLGKSRQQVARMTSGRASGIDYADLYILGMDPKANPEQVVEGALCWIEEARASGTTEELAHHMSEWLDREAEAEGAEDCLQQQVVRVLGSIAFMSQNLTLVFRRRAVAVLRGWEDEALRQISASRAAIGYARALRAKLDPSA